MKALKFQMTWPKLQSPCKLVTSCSGVGACKHSQVVAGRVGDYQTGTGVGGGGLIMAKPGLGKYSEIKGTKAGHLSRQEEDRGT